jgi:anthranilate synthase/aminodeoxychorismate synthase-like glutamine amidotransferase
MILLIDNYDSFAHNLARYVTQLGQTVTIYRNDAITIVDIAAMAPSQIIISPGPCTPNEAGIALTCVETFKETIPMLGVCLGHQVIGQVFGAQVVRATQAVHGKASRIQHTAKDLFAGLKNPLTVGRYHSLILSNENFPDSLRITASTTQNEIMAIEHRDYPLYGVQFHPESILTEQGYELLKNFLMLPTRP